MSVLIDNILAKLSKFTKKYYTNELIKGTLLFLSIGLIYLVLILVLENFMWLSPYWKRILFWTFILVQGILIFKFIGIPLLKLLKLSKGISKIEASKIIGKHFPEVNDQLTNLIQLSSQDNTSELLKASIEQKSKDLNPIPFNLAINFKKSFSLIKYAAIPVAIFAIVTFFMGKDWYGESFERVVNYNTAYNPPAPFYFKILNSAANS